MVFLFGMFIVGEALAESGYLAYLAHRFFSRAKNTGQLVAAILLGMGFLSALLMNDTLAIIGTPLMLGLAASFRIRPRLLLIALAFAITTGSVMSPIGNPQNLLVAVNSGMLSPFVTFAVFLIVPTLLSLGIAYGVLRFVYREDFAAREFVHEPPAACDPRMTTLVKCSLAILLTLAGANIIASLFGGPLFFTLPLIALLAAAPILVFSPYRLGIIRKIDWPTLIFFAAMFVLMAAVWETRFFQSFVSNTMVSSVPMILALSVVISQFISNVPFVALFQPMIMQAGGTTSHLMALAAGSTIAGNLTILGAASNVIIIQNAEKQGETISFLEFAKVGVPLTLLQIAVFWIFLAFI
jgi:Na+/H+ antiporter NhaD/arsenite permease-like protein